VLWWSSWRAVAGETDDIVWWWSSWRAVAGETDIECCGGEAGGQWLERLT